MSRFWPQGWEKDYEGDGVFNCDTCGKRVFYIEWTNGAQDYIGGSGWASVDVSGDPDVYCEFFDEEQGWITDHTHHVNSDDRKVRIMDDSNSY